ncbi:uncharacterized protein F5Z01DRAFT_653186 [Emericellopsis atlantica]|uniref:Uncharacterized protein n=1 Tax=Emericellopsis atlantica TaxID=2614577 RepID=A0A9P7ZP22_9HYPO|nr:uncharacterized protein F5Z01DRAFT_653186 [Emericellopsis atlantica]KAG9255476.1 hypothetical protein F5Z01DRAFT_653186 [Emericellopsis atlantica]
MPRNAISTTCPRSFLFCVVANVAPNTDTDTAAIDCRPLAITYRQGHGHVPAHGNHAPGQRVRHALDDVARAVAILTHPANRSALEAERAHAVAWYRHAGGAGPKVTVPDAPQPAFDKEYKGHWPERIGKPDRPELPCRLDPCEFPFTSTCLRLALTADDFYHTRYGDVQEQPLRCVFRADKLEHGLVVIDVSNLDDIRYGFVAPAIRYVADIAPDPGPGWGIDPVEPLPPFPHPPTPEAERSPSRSPMAASGFMTKFGLHESSLPLAYLKRHRVVARHALDHIWPVSIERRGRGSTSRSVPSCPDDGAGGRDLEPTIDRILQDAEGEEQDGLDMTHLHRASIDLPGFQTQLSERLRARPHGLQGLSASPLLRLAFANASHLNLAGFTGLKFEAIATSLRSEELAGIHALSLAIDECTGSLEALLQILSETDDIIDIFFLAHPSRSDDELSSRTFAAICASPLAPHILRSKHIKLTGAFSAPLRRKPWLLDVRGDRLVSESLARAYPVQHMFVRQQFTDPITGPQGREAGHPPQFRPLHFFLGDGLLGPERLVRGFLQYCTRLHADRFLTSFAACPPKEEDEDEALPGIAVTPIPAENLVAPCWPLFTGLDPGSWVLVVSHEWYVGPKTLARRARLTRRRIPTDAAFGVPVVRYAFLRAKQPVAWPDPRTRDAVELVGDLKSFLREAGHSGEGDLGWVDALVAHTVASIQETWQLEPLPPDLGSIMAMDDDMARSVFSDFLEHAAHIRGDVRENTDVFATPQGPGDALWPYALGADRPATPPEGFPWLPGEASSEEDL